LSALRLKSLGGEHQKPPCASGISIKSGEYFQLALDNPDGRGFILKESHGNWDGVKGEKAPGGSSEILSPPDGYLSSEEGNAAFNERKMFRARQGFLHGLIPSSIRKC
jgi:hypothetical protein